MWWSCAGSVISVAGRPHTGGCILSLLIIITIIITRLSGQAFRPPLWGCFDVSLCTRGTAIPYGITLCSFGLVLPNLKFVSVFLGFVFFIVAYLHVLHILCILHLFQHMYQCLIKYSNHQGSNRSSFSKVVSP